MLKVVGGSKQPLFASNSAERWSPAKLCHISFLMRYLFEKFSWNQAFEDKGSKTKKKPENQNKVDGMLVLLPFVPTYHINFISSSTSFDGILYSAYMHAFFLV